MSQKIVQFFNVNFNLKISTENISQKASKTSIHCEVFYRNKKQQHKKRNVNKKNEIFHIKSKEVESFLTLSK